MAPVIRRVVRAWTTASWRLGERVMLSYALGARAPFADISLLRASEVMELTNAGVMSAEYFPLKHGLATLLAPRFASALMQRHTLPLAMAAHLLGLRNYDYLFTAAAATQRHWSCSAASARAHRFEVS